MGLETGTYISDLVVTNPIGTDDIQFGDNHIRLLKSTIKNTFPNITGAVTATHTELNYVDGVTSAIQTQLNAKQAASTALTTSTSFGGDVSGTYNAIVVANNSHTHNDSTIDSLNASAITAGTMATARLGSGTANSTTFLRGDSTWQTVTSYTQPTTAGAVGTYAFLYQSSELDIAFGSTVAGSTLRPGGLYSFNAPFIYTSDGFGNYGNTGGYYLNTTRSGTWRCMGVTSNGDPDGGVNYGTYTLWLRIS